MNTSTIPRRRTTDFRVATPIESDDDVSALRSSGVLTRVGALLFLVALLAGLAHICRLGYLAFTDSFVAPMILSPDNDIVLAHKQKMMELEVQRSLAQATLEGVEADTAATEVTAAQLAELQGLASDSMRFTNEISSRQVTAGSNELGTLQEQHTLLREIHQRQSTITERAKKSLAASLITQGEYEKELQALRQAELNLLENNRSQAKTRSGVGQVMLGRENAEARGKPMMPELAMRQMQIAQIQLEMLRLQSEQRTKAAQKKVLAEQILKIHELELQLQNRPLFKAMEKSLHAAFVPYTQSEGVAAGGEIYQCVWGAFGCRPVGVVSELVPGEVTMPDPWGNPTRGQLILLALEDVKAATAKVLRVRPVSAKAP